MDFLGCRRRPDPETAAEVQRAKWLERRAREALRVAGWDASGPKLAAVIRRDHLVEPEDRDDVLARAKELRAQEQAAGRHHYTPAEIEAYMSNAGKKITPPAKRDEIKRFVRRRRAELKDRNTVSGMLAEVNARFGTSFLYQAFYSTYWSQAKPSQEEIRLGRLIEKEEPAAIAPPPPDAAPEVRADYDARAELDAEGSGPVPPDFPPAPAPLLNRIAPVGAATGNGNGLPPLEIVSVPANGAAASPAPIAEASTEPQPPAYPACPACGADLELEELHAADCPERPARQEPPAFGLSEGEAPSPPAAAPAKELEPATAAATSPAAGARRGRVELYTDAGSVTAKREADGSWTFRSELRTQNEPLVRALVSSLYEELLGDPQRMELVIVRAPAAA